MAALPYSAIAMGDSDPASSTTTPGPQLEAPPAVVIVMVGLALPPQVIPVLPGTVGIAAQMTATITKVL